MNENPKLKIRKNTESAACAAKKWFMSESVLADKNDWKNKNCEAKNIQNVVYAFFDKYEHCIYVGVSKRALKDRVRYQNSPHIKTKWWRKWDSLRVMEINDGNDRLFLEFLLIFSLAPLENRKPGFRHPSDLFKA